MYFALGGCCGVVILLFEKYFTFGGCSGPERELLLFESDGSLACLETDATCLLILGALFGHDLHESQPSCSSITDQDPGLLPGHHIVSYRMKLVAVSDVPSRQYDPSVAGHDATIICFKLSQSWFQGIFLGCAILSA